LASAASSSRTGSRAAAAATTRASRARLVFLDDALETRYRDDADARLLAGGHDLAAAFVILGVYAFSTIYVLAFARELDGEFLRSCRPLLGAGLALSLLNMLVVASLARAQAGARRRRAQLERRLASSSSSSSSSSSLRALIAAEAEAELCAARRRGAWSCVARVADTLPSLLFKPRCHSFWDPNWRRAAQSVASDSGAVWLALSAAQRLPASAWRALPWHTAAWLLSAARLAPEVCRKFAASAYHRGLVRRVYERLAAPTIAVVGGSVSGSGGGALNAAGAALDPSCSCHVLVGVALMAGGFALPLWAQWALERRARRRWLAAHRLPPCPDLAPRLPLAAALLAVLVSFNATWQVMHLLATMVCGSGSAAARRR
jgi:hypothetical protein